MVSAPQQTVSETPYASTNASGVVRPDPPMMVHVTAPATLPAGYTFEAEINGDPNKLFTCQVVRCHSAELFDLSFGVAVSNALSCRYLSHITPIRTMRILYSPKEECMKAKSFWHPYPRVTTDPDSSLPRGDGRMVSVVASKKASVIRPSAAPPFVLPSPWDKSCPACN
jgi:hypothetical protein